MAKFTNELIELPTIDSAPSTPDAGQARLYIRNNKTVNAIFDDGSNIVLSGGGSGGATALSDLTDVNISSPATNDVLTYDDNNSTWIAQTTPRRIDDLNDVVSFPRPHGSALIYSDNESAYVLKRMSLFGSYIYMGSPLSIPSYDSMETDWRVQLQIDTNLSSNDFYYTNSPSDGDDEFIDGNNMAFWCSPVRGGDNIMSYGIATLSMEVDSDSNNNPMFSVDFHLQDSSDGGVVTFSNAQRVHGSFPYNASGNPAHSPTIIPINATIPFAINSNNTIAYFSFSNFNGAQMKINKYRVHIDWYLGRNDYF